MVPTTRNLLHHDGKSSRGRSCYHPGQYYVGIAAQLEASAASARRQQDQSKPSRSPRLRAMAEDNDPAAAAGSGTSSPSGAGAGNDEGDWLQLGLAASAASSSSSASSSGDNNSTDPAPAPAPLAPMELDLFANDKRSARMRPPLFPMPLRSYHQSYGGSRGRYRPAAASGSMSAPFLPFMRPFRCSGDAIRVISPPRRTGAPGLWLTLQAAPNQTREPILPQIAKSYLRIKDDSNMKVEVVMKYLAEKLGIVRSHQETGKESLQGADQEEKLDSQAWQADPEHGNWAQHRCSAGTARAWRCCSSQRSANNWRVESRSVLRACRRPALEPPAAAQGHPA